MNNFVVTKYGNRYAVLDLKTNSYYFPKARGKKAAEKRANELNKMIKPSSGEILDLFLD